MRWRRGTFLLVLVLGAFLLRLAVVLALHGLNQGPVGPDSNDDVEFNHLAWHLAQGHGYVNEQGFPTSFRAPGFPLFLAGLYALAGQSFPLAYASFCALGGLACLLTYFLARELLDENLARLAAVLAAIYPPHVHLAATFLSENLFVPLLALGVWLFLRRLRTGSFGCLALAGLALGAATLVRPFGLLLLPLLLLVLAWAGLRQRRIPLTASVVLGVTFLAVIVPWTARNYRAHGKPVLIATNGGSTFYGGNNPRVAAEPRQFGHWISTTELPGRDQVEAAPDEVGHDQVEWRLGWQWLKENPAYWPRLVLFKVARLCFWLPDLEPANKYVRAACFGPFLLLFLPGVWTTLRRHDYRTAGWLVVHLTMLATVLTAVIFWGCPRFRDANAPLLMLYAAVRARVLAGWWSVSHASQKRVGQAPCGCGHPSAKGG
jgi:4-amino-4-deoxy-L-arabinose transferase-like glycosyltransferase